jgi:copper/silver efflux system protein
LVPIMWSAGAGSEVMQRIAVPMIGGMVSSTMLTLIVIPAVYGLVNGWRLPLRAEGDDITSVPDSAEVEAAAE